MKVLRIIAHILLVIFVVLLIPWIIAIGCISVGSYYEFIYMVLS